MRDVARRLFLQAGAINEAWWPAGAWPASRRSRAAVVCGRRLAINSGVAWRPRPQAAGELPAERRRYS